MAATPISPITKYAARGSSKTYWLTACADITAPTRLELDAGIDLTPQIADEAGWSTSVNQIETPDKDTRYTSTIPGVISSAESSCTMYADKEGADATMLMPQDETGFYVILDGGDIPGNKMRVFPVIVASVTLQASVDGSAADTNMFSFSITDEPALKVTVPA